MDTQAKTYAQNMIMASLAYAALMMGSRYLLQLHIFDNFWGQFFIALSPALPGSAMVYVIYRHFKSQDEYLRKVIGESIMISALIVGMISFTYGMIEGFLNFPKLGLVWVLPALFAFQGIALCFVHRHYQ